MAALLKLADEPANPMDVVETLASQRGWCFERPGEDEINMTAFDWDYVPYVDCGGICTAFNTTAPEVIEDNDEYRVHSRYGKNPPAKSSYRCLFQLDRSPH